MKPIKHWSDNDTAELILFDDGSFYTFDEKGAVCIDKDGEIISSYWRGDDEPFDVRQTIWHDTYSAEELDQMVGATRELPGSWSEASYDAIHYTISNPKCEAGARELARLVKEAK